MEPDCGVSRSCYRGRVGEWVDILSLVGVVVAIAALVAALLLLTEY
jgi:hypothetical protein